MNTSKESPSISTPAPSNPTVLGVDGSSGGWVVVRSVPGEPLIGSWASSFAELVEAASDAAVIAVDMPIGVPVSEPRECDVLARRFVGVRRSSVFTTPILAVLEAESYAEARSVSVERTGRSLSSQAWHLRKAIFEAAAFAGDPRVHEVHPEVSFCALLGGELSYPKKSWNGFQQRLQLLRDVGLEPPERIDSRKATVDDVLDATVAAWSARRIVVGAAGSLPAKPERIDGRAVAIWY